MSDIYARLAERFPAGDHKTKTIGGTDLTYVDGETVISRLNAVLGFDGWSFEVGQITVLEKEVWVTGKLTVYAGERTVVREQAGGQIINRTRAGEIIELSNDIKAAVTDCIKKFATLIGVGLYLYDPVERREVAAEMRAEKRQGGKPAPSKPDQKVEAAARVTGAPPQPVGHVCAECKAFVPAEGTVNITRSTNGQKIDVTVKDFEPVCVQRLGAFHCAACYDKKYWKVA